MEELLFQVGSHCLSKMDFLRGVGRKSQGLISCARTVRREGAGGENMQTSLQSSALVALLTTDITMLITSTLHLHDNDYVIIFQWSQVVDCGCIADLLT